MPRRVMVVLLVAGVSGPAMADLIWFTEQSVFEQFNREHGKALKGIEDYEESTVAPGRVAEVNDPLVSGVPNGPFLEGLTGLQDLQVQSNTGGDPNSVTPRGAIGLGVGAAGFNGIVTDIVVSNWQFDSHDLIFLSEFTNGVGGNLIDVFGRQSGITIRVYDTANNFLGEEQFPADITGQQFAGVWSDIAIGRLNLFSTGDGFEGMDNIQAWIPEPASLSLFALGGLALLRRRS